MRQEPAMTDIARPRWRVQSKLSYWIAGLPVALRNRTLEDRDTLGELRHAFSRLYWSASEQSSRRQRKYALILAIPLLLWQSARYTGLNGRTISQRFGRSIIAQLSDQLKVYLKHGMLPRWYYIFSLYEAGGLAPARDYLNRFETKPILFALLNSRGTSPLGDKVGFAAHCVAHGVPHIPVLAVSGGKFEADGRTLPPVDPFMKPINARGCRGAERWDWLADDRYGGPEGARLSRADLLARLNSGDEAVLVQPRAVNHPALLDLSNGALATLRVLTCLDEQGRPELVGAVLRMAVGDNRTVDNFHAGGIAAPVDLDTGRLGCASNLGDNVKLGWLSRHPDIGGQIEGRLLPLWPQVLALARQAHLAFADRVVVGWDIAILADGPSVVEGNSGPDVDIMQRGLKRGIGRGRFAELLLHHLRNFQTAPQSGAGTPLAAPAESGEAAPAVAQP